MAVRKHNGSWWVDFMYNHERLRKRSPLNTKGGAEAFEARLRQLVAQHGTVAEALVALERKVTSRPATLAEFAARWLRDYVMVNNKPSEQRNKRSALDVHLLPALGQLPLAEVSSRLIEQLKASLLEKRLSQKTINNYLTILRKCLDTAVEWGELAAVPRIRQLKTAPPPFRFLEPHEVETILTYAFDDEWRVMMLTAVRTGMRFGELSALCWSDIDFERRMIHVHRSRYLGEETSTKTHRSRHVPLASDVGEELRKRRGDFDGFVFERSGQPVPWHIASQTLQRICEAAGIRPFGWHTFRHTFASDLALRNVSIQVIRELLGHASIQMTLRYAHLTQDSLHDAIARLVTPQASSRELSPWCHPQGTRPISEPVSTPARAVICR